MPGFYSFCQTRKDRIETAKYWHEMRSIAAKIRDEYDLHSEDKFHNLFLQKCKTRFYGTFTKIHEN